MLGPAAAAVVPLVPGDRVQGPLPKMGYAQIPQGSLIVRKVFGRGLAPSQATANQISTPINGHTACEGMSAHFISIWCWPLLWIRCFLITNQTPLSHLLLAYYSELTTELVPAFGPYATGKKYTIVI